MKIYRLFEVDDQYIYIEMYLHFEAKVHYIYTEMYLHIEAEVHYRPQRSSGQGYVFTRVCDSVHRGGLRRTPPGTRQTPTPPGTRQDPPGRETPRDQAGPPRQGEPPGTRQTPPPPGRSLQHTVNERPVGILLECILVIFTLKHTSTLRLRYISFTLKHTSTLRLRFSCSRTLIFFCTASQLMSPLLSRNSEL